MHKPLPREVGMKNIALILMTAILLAGGTVAVLSAHCYAQEYEYPAPPPNIYASPWVGPETPWVYYNGDWFLNGILYYYFGPLYGWAPYYAYPPVYIVRPDTWYGPRWLRWYTARPQYWESFQREYPYWREHRQGQHYSQKFYEEHHGGQGGGWQKGVKGGPAAAPGVTHAPAPGVTHPPAPGSTHPPAPGATPPAAPGAKQQPDTKKEPDTKKQPVQ